MSFDGFIVSTKTVTGLDGNTNLVIYVKGAQQDQPANFPAAIYGNGSTAKEAGQDAWEEVNVDFGKVDKTAKRRHNAAMSILNGQSPNYVPDSGAASALAPGLILLQ